MHVAARQIDEQEVFDPYIAVNDNIAETQALPTTKLEPEKILSHLFDEHVIGQDERDAGEYIAKLAAVARSPLKSATVRYSTRTADRKWSMVEEQRHVIRPKLEAALSAVRYDPRRKAIVQALVVDPSEANVDLENPYRLAQALADVARYLWGVKKTATPILAPDNDNRGESTPPVRRSDNFDRMKARGQLDDDANVNDCLHAAGIRFANDHHAAGMQPLGAIDYSRTKVDGGGGGGHSEMMQKSRDRYRSALQVMGKHYAETVEAIVVHGQSLADAGRSHTRYRDEKRAAAAAMERLNAGLRLLAFSYGIIRRG